MELLTTALKQENWALVPEILRIGWTELFEHHPGALVKAINALPAALIAEHPRLRLARSYIRDHLNQGSSSQAFGEVFGESDGMAPVDRLSALTGQSEAARKTGRLDEALAAVRRGQQLLDALPVQAIPSLSNALPEIRHHWGVTLLLVGRFDEAQLEFQESHDWAVSIGHDAMRTASAGSIAYLHSLSGRNTQAQLWLDRLPRQIDGSWWSSFAATPALLARAMVAHDSLQPHVAAEALAQIEVERSMDLWSAVFFVQAATLTVSGRGMGTPARGPSEDPFAQLAAVATFTQNLRERQLQGVHADYLSLARFILLAQVDQPSRAERELDGMNAEGASSSLLNDLGVVWRARQEANRGRRALAGRLLDSLRQRSDARPRVLLSALLIEAEMTRGSRSRQLLDQAARLAHWHGSYAALAEVASAQRHEMAARLAALGAHAVAGRLSAGRSDRPRAAELRHLTPREASVARLAADGSSNRDLAEQLQVSQNTIKSQLRSAYRKLGVSSRSQLAEKLRELEG